MARPFAAPPGIPADRKAALVAAFDATMKDPEYLADAKKLDIDVNPVSGKALDESAGGALRDAEGRAEEGRRGDHEVSRLVLLVIAYQRHGRAWSAKRAESSDRYIRSRHIRETAATLDARAYARA